MTAEQQKLIPARDENLKNGNYTVLNGEYTKNFNVYVVGENHKEAIDYIMVAREFDTFFLTTYLIHLLNKPY